MNWRNLAKLIQLLSDIAVKWYKLVEGDREVSKSHISESERRARKAASVVIDPDTPEQDIAEVKD